MKPAPPSPQGPGPTAWPRPRHGQAVAIAGMITILATIIAMIVYAAGTLPRDGERVLARSAANAGRAQGSAARSVADPTSVHVASRGIAAGTIPLGKNADGTIQVPEDAEVTGWWVGGPNPGEPGASVIVGHVDSHHGPGAFFGLAAAGVGERVTVERADGSSVHFRVRRVETHAKDAFPTQAVYAPTDAPTLRLVTCAGRFDRATGSYEDNVVVFAELEADETTPRAEAPVQTPSAEAAEPEGTNAAGGPAARAPGTDRRDAPIGVATLSVICAAAAVTRQAVRGP